MWTTDSEIAAINSFGFNGREHSYDGQVIDRLRILRGYIEASKYRSNWDRIHKKTCVAYAQSLIHTMLDV